MIVILKGSQASGWYGPPKGTHVVSRHMGATARVGRKYQVGITSARPGKPESKVRSEMQAFRSELSGVARDVNVEMGTGGWAGGHEPTWVTEFSDGPKALAVVARTARDTDQDAALVMRYVPKNASGAQPQVRLSFNSDISSREVSAVENTLTSVGIGGWTWANMNGKPVLMAVSVPQWGGDADKHQAAMSDVQKLLADSGYAVNQTVKWVDVTVMERGGYDKWLQ